MSAKKFELVYKLLSEKYKTFKELQEAGIDLNAF